MVKLVGILNTTPDSFSDGGKFNSLEFAISQTQKLIDEGADVIDIGAESTRPNATPITQEEEWQRLKNILPAIVKLAHKHNIEVSLDTRNARTAEEGLKLGIDIINDVSACADPSMIPLLTEYDCPIVINHNLGVPADPNNIVATDKNIIDELKIWAKTKILELLNAGVKQEKIIFDVGIGFGKNAEQSLAILENIKEFKTLGVQIYVGHSRKSFLKLFKAESLEEKDLLTAKFSKQIAPFCDYIRVHNIAINKNY